MGKYQDIDSNCVVCGNGELKTVGDVVQDCKGLNPLVLEVESDLTRALGVFDRVWIGRLK